MTQPLRALRFLTAFQCIAERCEDTCCTGLSVSVDRASLHRLQALTSVEDPQGVRLHVLVGEASARADEAGFIRPRADGSCPFLDVQRHCGLQKRYGPESLGNTCAMFPRSVRATPVQVEVTGSLACPEALRLLLATPEALAWTPVTPDFLPREPALPSPDLTAQESLRHRLAGPLTDTLVRSLSDDGVSLGARWVLLGQLCANLEGLLDRPATDDAVRGLEGLLALHLDAGRRANVQGLLRALELPTDKVVTLIGELVQARLTAPVGARLAERLSRAGDPSTWARRLAEAKTRTDLATRSRVERNLALCAAHGFLRRPPQQEEDPGLEVGTALLRSVLASSLITLELVDARPTEEQVDAVCVETLQILAKGLDSHPLVLDRARELLACEPEERARRMFLLASAL